MRPIRFCMVTTFYPPASFGGDAVQVRRLAHALAERGHEVTVVHALDAYRALGGQRERPADDDSKVRVVPLAARSGSLSPLATHVTGRPLLSRRALERALHGPYDVIHFHNPSLIGGPAVLGMGRASLRLYTAHEQWLLCPTHVLWKNKREVCEQPTCVRCTLRHGRPPQLWRQGSLLERSLTELDALIAPSRTSARLHERLADVVRIEHLPHFVDPPRRTTELRRERPYFLFVGRHEPIKGVEKLIEAFRRRRSEDLLIAGEGPLTEELKRSAADLPHVHFIGWQEPGMLDALYRGALAVVVPTLGHESFGLVAVEGFARGTPAIVHGFSALGELIADSDGGIAYHSKAELDLALERIASEPELRRQLGERARAAYVERWTAQTHLRRYFGLIQELADFRGAYELVAAAEMEAAAIPAAGPPEAIQA